MPDLSPSPAPAPFFDEDGFFLCHQLWSEELARALARRDGVGELGEEGLLALRTLREEFLQRCALPSPRHVCHLIGAEPDCLSRVLGGPREAWRLAGLPNPGEEAKSYL